MGSLPSTRNSQRTMAGRSRCIFPVITPKGYISLKPIMVFTAWYVCAWSNEENNANTTLQKIVRQTFHEAVERRPYTYDPHHAEHCFDALRQVSLAPNPLHPLVLTIDHSLSYVTPTAHHFTPLATRPPATDKSTNVAAGNSSATGLRRIQHATKTQSRKSL